MDEILPQMFKGPEMRKLKKDERTILDINRVRMVRAEGYSDCVLSNLCYQINHLKAELDLKRDDSVISNISLAADGGSFGGRND